MPTAQLVATAWTSAGDVSPMRNPATSPIPIADRVAAIADAGFTGFGLIERWWIPRGRLGHSYDVRDLLFEAADTLCPGFIKIGSEQRARTTDLSELVAPLRELGEQAQAHGTRVAIEPMPFSIIDTVPILRIPRAVGCGDPLRRIPQAPAVACAEARRRVGGGGGRLGRYPRPGGVRSAQRALGLATELYN